MISHFEQKHCDNTLCLNCKSYFSLKPLNQNLPKLYIILFKKENHIFCLNFRITFSVKTTNQIFLAKSQDFLFLFVKTKISYIQKTIKSKFHIKPQNIVSIKWQNKIFYQNNTITFSDKTVKSFFLTKTTKKYFSSTLKSHFSQTHKTHIFR